MIARRRWYGAKRIRGYIESASVARRARVKLTILLRGEETEDQWASLMHSRCHTSEELPSSCKAMVLAAPRRETGHGPRRIAKAFEPIKGVPGYREREFVSSVVQGTQFRFLIRT